MHGLGLPLSLLNSIEGSVENKLVQVLAPLGVAFRSLQQICLEYGVIVVPHYHERERWRGHLEAISAIVPGHGVLLSCLSLTCASITPDSKCRNEIVVCNDCTSTTTTTIAYF